MLVGVCHFTPNLFRGFAPNPISFFFLIRKTKQKESRKNDPIRPLANPRPAFFHAFALFVISSNFGL
jgi:hypothetical protein